MEALISWNNKLAAIGRSDVPAFVKQLQKLPVYERFAKNLLQVRPGCWQCVAYCQRHRAVAHVEVPSQWLLWKFEVC
jgi:aldehyde:ferredoxin oxidoreductase